MVRRAGSCSISAVSGWPTSTARGTTDIIYLGGDGVHLYFNQSGNSWSPAASPDAFPAIDNLSSVQAAGSARQRHRLPGVVVATTRRARQPHALHRPDGRAEAASAGQDRKQSGRGDPRAVCAVDQVLSRGQACRQAVDHARFRFPCMWSSGSRSTTASAATDS